MAKPMQLKRCYYETLEVESEASEEELKKAYRIQALRWHPDKNPEDAETAGMRFKEVQAAYDCLSDPRERAWYDKHRDHILRGSDRDGIDDTSSFDLLPFFLSSSYSGYGDDENSFFTVYRKVFDEIIKEESMYFDADENCDQFPRFGDRSTEYSDVHAFYSFWSAYNTRKSFLNVMKYDTREAENRREARAMEKENNKLREVKRKNRNNEIRSLVAFIKRRDKRVLERKKKLNSEVEEKRKKSQEHNRKQMKEKKEKLFRDSFKESEWTSMAQLEASLAKLEEDLSKMELKSKKKSGLKFTYPVCGESEERDENEERDERDESEDPQTEEAVGATGCDSWVDSLGKNTANLGKNTENSGKNTANSGEIFDTSENDDGSNLDNEVPDEEDIEELVCIACNKSFKSVKSFENHERSKKHRVNVTKLKEEMEQDDQLLL